MSASPTKATSSTSPPLLTTTPTSTTTTTFPSTTLPPASTFDILPPLHSLLARLVPSPTSPDAPLEPQHLVTEATALKIRLQKARAAVDSLPDIQRLPEEQAREIGELESRIASQRDVLKELGRRAKEGGSS
ncbi:MAG: hypothetical protein M1838_003451 [Thelocarpon superellum]|nr:MAG: hypothetical protein M1838_003451 [Thelocarpon superellum]